MRAAAESQVVAAVAVVVVAEAVVAVEEGGGRRLNISVNLLWRLSGWRAWILANSASNDSVMKASVI